MFRDFPVYKVFVQKFNWMKSQSFLVLFKYFPPVALKDNRYPMTILKQLFLIHLLIRLVAVEVNGETVVSTSATIFFTISEFKNVLGQH